MTEGDQDDTSGDAAEDVDRNGEEFRLSEEARAKPLAARGARARWSGDCRTTRSAVGAGSALQDGGLSVGISGGRADEQPYISIDYGYLAGDATPVLVVKDRLSGMVFAMAVERKGVARVRETLLHCCRHCFGLPHGATGTNCFFCTTGRWFFLTF